METRKPKIILRRRGEQGSEWQERFSDAENLAAFLGNDEIIYDGDAIRAPISSSALRRFIKKVLDKSASEISRLGIKLNAKNPKSVILECINGVKILVNVITLSANGNDLTYLEIKDQLEIGSGYTLEDHRITRKEREAEGVRIREKLSRRIGRHFGSSVISKGHRRRKSA